jgi:hypothetical protein
METWIAILWMSCTGYSCPTVSMITQPDELTCHRVEVMWLKMSEQNKAACVYDDIDKLTVILDDTKETVKRLKDLGW